LIKITPYKLIAEAIKIVTAEVLKCFNESKRQLQKVAIMIDFESEVLWFN